MIATTETRHMIKETCTRCCGSGITGHRRCNGVCFRCSGNGFTLTEAVFSIVPVEYVPTSKQIEDMGEASWLMDLFTA